MPTHAEVIALNPLEAPADFRTNATCSQMRHLLVPLPWFCTGDISPGTFKRSKSSGIRQNMWCNKSCGLRCSTLLGSNVKGLSNEAYCQHEYASMAGTHSAGCYHNPFCPEICSLQHSNPCLIWRMVFAFAQGCKRPCRIRGCLPFHGKLYSVLPSMYQTSGAMGRESSSQRKHFRKTIL